MVRHIGRPNGAEIDRVVGPQFRQPVRRHHDPVLFVVVGPPIEMIEAEREAAVAGGAGVQSTDAGGDHLRADTVAWDGGNLVRLHPELLTRLAGYCREALGAQKRDRVDAGPRARAITTKKPEETPCSTPSRPSRASARRTRSRCLRGRPSCSARAATS